MATSPILGLYLPIGTLKATASAGGTTTTFLTPDADAVDVPVGMKFRLFTSDNRYKEKSTFSVVSKSSSLGTTTITFEPAAAAVTDITNRMYEPEVPDVTTAISNQFEQLDGQIQCVECTSSTRPVPPQRFTGIIIFETDTGLLMTWNGSTWQQINDPGAALGSVGAIADDLFPAINLAASTEVLVVSLPMNLTAGRRYLVRWNCVVFNTGGIRAPVAIRWRMAAGGTVTVAAPIQSISRVDYFTSPATATIRCDHAGFFVLTPGSSGQQTLGMFARRGADGGATNLFFEKNCNFFVEDIGAV